MNIRRDHGATLGLVVVFSILLTMLFACFYILTKIMGGERELQNATDSGSLNVAKQSLKHPAIGLLAGAETKNFSAQLDTNGGVDLLTYNRIVGQSLLVALNASAEGTSVAEQNARTLLGLAETDKNSIGARLQQNLNTPTNLSQSFLNLAGINSVRMDTSLSDTASQNSQYKISYMKAGTPTNIDYNPNSLPYIVAGNGIGPALQLPNGSVSAQKSSRNYNYINGYTAMAVSGVGYVTGVPVRPQQPPHLVALKDFNAALSTPAHATNIPPNSFQASGMVLNRQAISAAVVGSLTADYTASIPSGYIVVKNGPTTSFTGVLGDNNQIFANELMTGIYVSPVGNNQNNTFTTNINLYDQWLAYNQNPAAYKSPPSTAGIYGNPATITQPAVEITWLDYTANPSALAGGMLNAFQNTYGSQYSSGNETFTSNTEMNIENMKAQIIAGFALVTHVHDPSDPHYFCHVTSVGPTGLKYFNHSQVYSAPTGTSIDFGKTGSLAQLLPQCNANSALEEITQRMYQMKPTATAGEITSFLNAAMVPMASTQYIYLNNAGNFVISSAPPSGFTGVQPDGALQSYASSYDPIFKAIDSRRDGKTTVYPFDGYWTTTGIDTCQFTPSSGYNNLLGEVNFTNNITFNGGGTGGGGGSNQGLFWDPN
jgi:hypothetical protein